MESTITTKSAANTFNFSEFSNLDNIIKKNKMPGLRLKKVINAFKELSARDKLEEIESWEVAFENAAKLDNSPLVN